MVEVVRKRAKLESDLAKTSNRTLFSLLYKIGLVYSVEKHLWKYRNYFFKGKVKDFSINDTEKH